MCGYVPRIAFEKHCRTYALTADGRELLATVVRVPELDGTFLEVETVVADEEELAAGLAAVRAVLGRLGVADGDLYTDAVVAAR
ncbi:hypothetical protein GCM10023235_25030 [Kitasatospora terrestris]|uniref:CYTH domain-containing protein n=1 Tax=Kitasatospora terrestris TaxID=258051 RepID=A0ABP9DJF0_9ACTN